MRRNGLRSRVARFGAFTAGVMISGRIFRRTSRDTVDVGVRDFWHDEIDGVEAELGRINDVFLGALARTLLLG